MSTIACRVDLPRAIRTPVATAALLGALAAAMGGAAPIPASARPAHPAGVPMSLVVAADDRPSGETARTGLLSLYNVSAFPPVFQADGTVRKEPSETDSPTTYTDVAAADNVIVAASQDGGWHLFEIVGDGTLAWRSTSRAGPLVDGRAADARSTALVGGAGDDLYAYVGWEGVPPFGADISSEGGIDVYRVAPRSVTRVNRIADLAAVTAFAVQGDRLLAATAACGGFTGGCTQTLLVYDIASPAQPRRVGEGLITDDFLSFGSPRSVAIGGTFALVADGFDVHLVSIGTLNGDPTPFVTRETPGEAMAVAVAEDRFYIADGSNGFISGDIRGLASGPLAWVARRGSRQADAPAATSGDAVDVAVDPWTNRAYVATAGARIDVYDVGQRTPVWEHAFVADDFGHAVAVFPYTVKPPCTDDARLVTGNRATVTAGARFQVAPVLINTGTCTWSAADGHHLAHVGGDRLGAAARVDVAAGASHPPGQGQSFVLSMTAPGTGGRVVSRWQMRSDAGAFGPLVDVIVDVEAVTPTPSHTPTRTPTPTPTAAPIPPANPPELGRKDALVGYLERPGVQVLGMTVPAPWRPYVPQVGYDEDEMQTWLARFRAQGYSERDLRLLRRAIAAEEAIRSYYDQSVQLSDTSAGAAARLVMSLDGTVRVVSALERAARASRLPLAGTTAQAMAEARRILTDAMVDMFDATIDLTVPDTGTFPMAGSLKLAYAALLDIFANTPDSQVKARIEEAGIHLGIDLFAMNTYVLGTQGAVDQTTDNVQAGRLEGDDATAARRVADTIQATELATGTAIETAKQEMRFADIVGMTSGVATLVALATGAGSNPLSMVATITAQVTKVVELITLGHVAYQPMKLVVDRGRAIPQTAGLAFAPRLAAGAPAATGPKPWANGDRAAAPARTSAEDAVLDDDLAAYRSTVGRLDAALARGDTAAVGRLIDELAVADRALVGTLGEQRGPAIAAVRETGASAGAHAEVGRELAEMALVHHSARLDMQWDLVRVLLAPDAAAMRDARAATGVAQSTASAYADTVRRARDATAGVPIPAYLVVAGMRYPAGPARPGEVFDFEVVLRNVGGGTALDTRATVKASPSLRLLSGAYASIGSVPVGADAAVALRLRSNGEDGGFVTLTVTERSGRVMVVRVPVTLRGSGAAVYLPKAEQER